MDTDNNVVKAGAGDLGGRRQRWGKLGTSLIVLTVKKKNHLHEYQLTPQEWVKFIKSKYKEKRRRA